jgi:CRP-like cAMP-binding protein/nucleoside diphosphate kinase
LTALVSSPRNPGFTVLRQSTITLSTDKASQFYEEHKGKPFFDSLVSFMTSGPITIMVLEKHQAITAWRKLLGPTNTEKVTPPPLPPPQITHHHFLLILIQAKAEDPSCIRAKYGTDGTQNACHGSDSIASAAREISTFFPDIAATTSNMTPAEVQKYLETLVVPVLTEALADMCLQKPHDPFKWLASYLLEHNPRGSTKLEFAEAVVSVLKTGDYFGEIALLTNKPRQVTVRCKTDCVLLMLDRDSFNRLCGPLFELMKRNIDSYQKFASSLIEAGQSDAADVASAALAATVEDDSFDESQQAAPDVNAAAAAAVANRGRRTTGRSKAVFVAPIEFEAAWTPPVFEKTEQLKSELNELLQKSVLLKNLDAAAKSTVVNALQSRDVANGSSIITQGEAGDLFYILGLGTAKAFVKKGEEEAKCVKDYVPGDTFGELALLHGEPRAASIIATSDCLVWGLDRDTFRRIMMQVCIILTTPRIFTSHPLPQAGTAESSLRDGFIEKIPILASLDKYERFKVAEALIQQTFVPLYLFISSVRQYMLAINSLLRLFRFKAGEAVIQEGDSGNAFYIVKSGQLFQMTDQVFFYPGACHICRHIWSGTLECTKKVVKI